MTSLFLLATSLSLLAIIHHDHRVCVHRITTSSTKSYQCILCSRPVLCSQWDLYCTLCPIIVFTFLVCIVVFVIIPVKDCFVGLYLCCLQYSSCLIVMFACVYWCPTLCRIVYWCPILCRIIYWCPTVCRIVYWCPTLCRIVYWCPTLCRIVYWCLTLCRIVYWCPTLCRIVYWCPILCRIVYWCQTLCRIICFYVFVSVL